KTMLERIADKFLVGDGCWPWTGAKNQWGYGRVHDYAGDKLVQRQAHRVVYELLRGPIPEGTEPDHLCRNPGCVNPGHLEPVSHQENIQRGKRRELCPQGHALIGSNLAEYRHPNNRQKSERRCKRCHREREAARRARMKESA